jgi:hypothetical protein
MEPIRNLIKVPVLGRLRFSLVLFMLAIKPDVVGKRIQLIRTDNPYSDLKPKDRVQL